VINIFAVDFQNCFTDPQGSMYVGGAEKDAARAARFIENKHFIIRKIFLTGDAHPALHIANTIFWHDEAGRNPDPFAHMISVSDVESGKWRVVDDQYHELVLRNLRTRALYPNKFRPLVPWPVHGSAGAQDSMIYPLFMDAVQKWAIEKPGLVRMTYKGMHPCVEQNGVFEGEIQIPEDPSTHFQKDLFNDIFKSSADMTYVMGEAGSHCVADAIDQVIDRLTEQERGKVTVLTDCMSPVRGYDDLQTAFFERVKKAGMRLALSTDAL
jgi:nicotinamidase/pyrazinamidase